MKRETAKALLANGILQAYAEGKEVEYKHYINGWEPVKELDFSDPPENYRIKPTPQLKVGDLVRTKHDTVCKVKEYLHDETYKVTPLGRDFSLCFHVKGLTPVREVRTPLTFEQAVKLVAEKGFKIEGGISSGTVTSIGEDAFKLDPGLLSFENAKTHKWHFLDGTPVYNVTYEDIT